MATKFCTVPFEPTREQWGGLARAIMMAFDMGCKTPREIFRHLERTCDNIPDWLRNVAALVPWDGMESK